MDLFCKTALAARARGDKFYFPERPCRQGHLDLRYAANYRCVKCKCSETQALNRRKKNSAKQRVYRTTAQAWAAGLLCGARDRAKAKGVPFNLTRDWIAERLDRGCELTGLAFVRGKKNSRSATIDRKIPAKGYTQENCRVIVWCLNAALGDWGEQETRRILAAWKE